MDAKCGKNKRSRHVARNVASNKNTILKGILVRCCVIEFGLIANFSGESNFGQSAPTHGASDLRNGSATSMRPQIQYEDSASLYGSPNEPSTSSARVDYDSANDCVIIDDYEAQFSPIRALNDKNSPASPKSESRPRVIPHSPVPTLLSKLIPIEGLKCQALSKKERESQPLKSKTLAIPLLSR